MRQLSLAWPAALHGLGLAWLARAAGVASRLSGSALQAFLARPLQGLQAGFAGGAYLAI